MAIFKGRVRVRYGYSRWGYTRNNGKGWHGGSDEEGLDQVAGLLRDEGLCLGLSSGINVAGAIRLARDLGPGKTVVTILCDTGFRYLSSLYNREWLEAKGLPVFAWLKD